MASRIAERIENSCCERVEKKADSRESDGRSAWSGENALGGCIGQNRVGHGTAVLGGSTTIVLPVFLTKEI